MPANDFEAIFAALQGSGARYLVVGGVAVVLHGHPRFTADLDLVVALEPDNVRSAMEALEGLGYRPRAPVQAEGLADPETRRVWIEEKGLTVFSLWSPEHPATEVDVFVEEPFPFDVAYERAMTADLGGVQVAVAGFRDLAAMKQKSGRAKDLEDVAALRTLYGEESDD